MSTTYSAHTNPISDFDPDMIPDGTITLDWDDKDLVRITRLRLVTDPGFPNWDISYCYGAMRGEKGMIPVRVRLPFAHIPRKGMKSFLIDQARKAGIFAKGLGLLDDDVISKIW